MSKLSASDEHSLRSALGWIRSQVLAAEQGLASDCSRLGHAERCIERVLNASSEVLPKSSPEVSSIESSARSSQRKD